MSPRTAVLEVLRDRSTAARSWWSCTNLARRVRLPPDEVRRALLELVEHGAVERTVLDESGRLREVWRAKGPAGRPAHGRGEDGVGGERPAKPCRRSTGSGGAAIACSPDARTS